MLVYVTLSFLDAWDRQWVTDYSCRKISRLQSEKERKIYGIVSRTMLKLFHAMVNEIPVL